MRVMVIVKASPDSEQDVMPTTEELTAMGAFNEELVNAGIMRDGDGLKASSFGTRIVFDGTSKQVVEGPFEPTKELIAGYWIWEVDSLDDAVSWAQRIPFSTTPGSESWNVELRPFITMEDFLDAMTPDLAAQENQLREQSQQR